MILAPHLPSPHQIERLALQADMPAFEEVIHGIEHPRRTTAVAMRLVEHRIIVNFTHQAVRTGQGPLNGRTHLLRFPDIEQIRARMRIAERDNRLVEELNSIMIDELSHNITSARRKGSMSNVLPT